MKIICAYILMLSLYGCSNETIDNNDISINNLPELPVTINYQEFDLTVQKQFKQRIEYIKLLKKNNVENIKLSWAIGQLCKTYQAYLKNENARDCYINAIFFQPEKLEWHYLLAHVYKQIGEFDKSSSHYQKVLTIENYIPAKIWLSDVLIQQNKWIEAQKLNLSILDINPNHAMALYYLAIIEQHNQNQDLAIEYLTKALKLQPQAFQLNYQLGIIYSKLKQGEIAQKYFDKVPDDDDLKVSITFSDPLMQGVSDLRKGAQTIIKKAMKASKQGHYNVAIQLFNETIKSHPNRIDAVYNLAVVYVKINKLKQAKQLLNKIKHHEDANVYSLLATVNMNLNDLEEAISNVKKALAQQPDENIYLNQMGDILASSEQYLQAIEFYKKSIEINTHQELVKLKLARVFIQKNKINAIKKIFTNSTFLPKYEITKQNILSRIDSSNHEFKNYLEFTTDNFMSQETLAIIAAHKNNYEKAIFHQIDALEYAKNKRDISRIKDRLESYRKNQLPQSLWNIDEPLIIN